MAQPVNTGPKSDGTAHEFGAKSVGTTRLDEAKRIGIAYLVGPPHITYKSVGTAHKGEAASVGISCPGKAKKTCPDCISSGKNRYRPTGLLISVCVRV